MNTDQLNECIARELPIRRFVDARDPALAQAAQILIDLAGIPLEHTRGILPSLSQRGCRGRALQERYDLARTQAEQMRDASAYGSIGYLVADALMTHLHMTGAQFGLSVHPLQIEHVYSGSHY